MDQTPKTMLTFAVVVTAAAMTLVIFYEREGFEGRSFTTVKQMGNFERHAFNDRSFSVMAAEAVVGSAVGARVGCSNTPQATARQVQRCETVPAQTQPSLWDVAYDFRGQGHRVQLTNPPGATVTVDRNGEPSA